MPTCIGTKVVWGVREPKPITGAPPGRQRLRMRSGKTTKLFVKAAEGIRVFALEDKGDTWHCRFEEGRNLRSAQDVIT